MPHVVHIWSSKGGSCKSTTAINLAGGLSCAGSRVLLVDLDPNGSEGGALRWAAQAHVHGRQPAFLVSPAMPRHTSDFDYIIVDHPPGRPTRLPEGLVLLPATLDAGNFFSTRRSIDLLRKKCKSIVIASRVRMDRADQRALLAVLGDGNPLAVSDRAIFASAYGIGATIWDDDAGLRQAPSARAEFMHVVTAVQHACGASRTASVAA